MAASSSLRSWRTAFLTLRDETLTFPPRTSLLSLLHHFIFSHSDSLVVAAPELPLHEVTSDVMFLVELVATTSESEDVDTLFLQTLHLIHEVSRHVSLEMNSSSWALTLGFLRNVVHFFFNKVDAEKAFLENSSGTKVTMQVLEILRYFANAYGRKCSPLETTQLVRLLLHVVVSCHTVLLSLAHSFGNQPQTTDNRIVLKSNNLWEVEITAFVMIADAFLRLGSSVQVDMWQSALEVLRKVMDVLPFKSIQMESNVMSRFFTSLLRCLHLVLSDPKGSLSEHVASFVAALRIFFIYGLTNRPALICPGSRCKKEITSTNHLSETKKIGCSRYRPPHLRKKEGINLQSHKDWDSPSLSDNEFSMAGFTSSDSEHSDNDGQLKDVDYFRSSKARVAAIICIQDICQADPKSLIAHWTMVLPTNDVLQPRKHEATLMTCLLFDPVLKVRLASASTLAVMLDRPSSVFLQVAEYKESTRCGSFTPLSSSLGQILMQLHTGILYLLQRETHSGLLASVFKVLLLLISATPYARLPGVLLPAVISFLRTQILEGFKIDQTGLLAIALNCLGAAFSTSPPSFQVKEMLQEEISKGFLDDEGKKGVLLAILKFSERDMHPTVSFEALQTLRSVSHNYPNIVAACWEHVSAVIFGLLGVGALDILTSDTQIRPSKPDFGSGVGSLGEKFITCAVKVLDECLRAISGFKGTEDLLGDRLETPFMSDCTRTKRISSAPKFGLECLEVSKGNLTENSSGSKQWCEALEKHLPLILFHSSPMVRATSITCFAGITSSVFFSLTKEKQNFIISSSISAALNDEAPQVKSSACRAIGVIACFPQISYSTKILNEFIHAVEINIRDPLVSVRITASWALANICDSFRHRASDLNLQRCSAGKHVDPDSDLFSMNIILLAECALRLTKDGDKIKSNAVRALGSLSRFVNFSHLSSAKDEPVCMGSPLTTNINELLHSSNDSKASHGSLPSGNLSDITYMQHNQWLDTMVQAFLSCVATGNVKVQWNVCHAFSNLFLNETLRLQDMAWAPSVFNILLLLLRDSSNFKVKIHAAAALAVPASRLDYGRSFSDVVQGLEHMIESLNSYQFSTPSDFKYKAALEKQLTSTTLHVLELASCSDHESLKDFLVKAWLKSLCSSLEEARNQPGMEASPIEMDTSISSKQKKDMICKTVRSLVEVYECSHNQGIAQRFQKLIDNEP
ncbi:PREDICTED: HEAT repeat-containing protein 6 isoform X2 [Nelumbo nucifera]|uniref:DUF4042 domain-containing protein n=2 Tax=Nelumbo nucifera TaxID=4432 RepID=A0A822YY02_NELNU|nr:PREDICTED: HEAT repeat-containing protein 6 isoform X2 [Nelumbo nucifera]DAD36065.1 TPA_asm: hypothetical protein HUJ06_006705 [Nelumbo nucifera]